MMVLDGRDEVNSWYWSLVDTGQLLVLVCDWYRANWSIIGTGGHLVLVIIGFVHYSFLPSYGTRCEGDALAVLYNILWWPWLQLHNAYKPNPNPCKRRCIVR